MNIRQVFILILLASLWGGSFMFIRMAVPDFGAIPLSASRSVIAAITLMPLMLVRGLWPVFRQHWVHIMVIGLISTALPFSLITISTQYTSAGFASILNSLTPVFSAIVAWLWLKEYLSLAVIIGILLSFLGVMIMMFDRETIASNLLVLPVLAGLGATFLYGLTGNYSRRYIRDVPTLVIAAGCQLFSALFLLPVALVLWPDAPIPVQSWVFAFILGIFCTGLAFILYFHLLSKVGVARTVLVTYLVPVFAMLFGSMFLDENITFKMLAGALCILAGIALATYKPGRVT